MESTYSEWRPLYQDVRIDVVLHPAGIIKIHKLSVIIPRYKLMLFPDILYDVKTAGSFPESAIMDKERTTRTLKSKYEQYLENSERLNTLLSLAYTVKPQTQNIFLVAENSKLTGSL